MISRQIANAHTTFNIVCTLVWLPFIWVLVKIVMFLIRGEDAKAVDESKSKYLDHKILNQPVFAIKMVTQEIEDMALNIKEVLSDIRKELKGNDLRLLTTIKEECEVLSKRNEETLLYLASLFAGGSLTENQAGYASDMLILLENLGNITNRCTELNDLFLTKQNKRLDFSIDASEDLNTDITAVERLYDQIILYLRGQVENPTEEFNKNKDKLVKLRNKARKNNAKRMQDKHCKKESGNLFNQIMFSLERITHDCFNMLENNISQFQIEIAEDMDMIS